MSKSKDKLIRYNSLVKTVVNWKYYLLMKMIGFKENFNFQIKNFGSITVDKSMLSPFRENFLDNIYFRYIPEELYANKSNPVVIDIGANVGFFSLAAFSKLPKAKIYSFEPHPYCFEVLSNYKNDFKHLDWNIFNNAVSSEEGTISLNTNTISGFTTVASVFNNETKSEEFSAKSIKLDAFLSKEEITNVDFIKIDCEGAEYAIIYSLPEEVFEKINSLCIETHKGEGADQNINFLNDYMKKIGYTTKMLDEKDYTGYIWAWKG